MVDPVNMNGIKGAAKIADQGNGTISQNSSGKPFSSLMNTNANSTQQAAKPSIFDIANAQTGAPSNPSFDTLLSSAKSSQALLGDMSTNLNTKDLKLKNPTRSVLRNKLSNATTLLEGADQKLGGQTATSGPSSGKGVIHKLTDFVDQGMASLRSVQDKLSSMREEGHNLTAADFLSIQVKMSQAQQSLELSSMILGKAVEGFKQLMNTQI